MSSALPTLRPARLLAGIALVFAGGCLTGLLCPVPAVPALLLAAAAFFLPFAVRRRGISVAPLLFAAVFLLGAVHGRTAALEDRPVLTFLERLAGDKAKVSATGRILTDPEGFAFPNGGARMSFRFLVEDLRSEGGGDVAGLPPLPFSVDVDFYCPVSFISRPVSPKAPRAGEGWTFGGSFKTRPAEHSANPFPVLKSSPRDGYSRRPERNAMIPRMALWNLRHAFADRLSLGIPASHPYSEDVLRAVLLGYRSDVPRAVHDVFEQSGTIHFFAISGLHVMAIATVLFWLLHHLLGLSRARTALALLPVLVVYVLLTGARPSAQRACVMAAFYYGAALFRRKSDAPTALGGAALALLAVDPRQLYDIGFVFSFASIAGILLLARPLNARLLHLTRPFRPETDRLEAALEAGTDPEIRRHPPGFVRAGREFKRLLCENLGTSVAAWAAATPITATVFAQMTPVSVLSNIPILFLGTIMVYTACAGMLLGLVHPALQVPFNCVSSFLVQGMLRTANFCSRIPGGNFDVSFWTPWLSVLWYALLAAAALWLHSHDVPEEDGEA